MRTLTRIVRLTIPVVLLAASAAIQAAEPREAAIQPTEGVINLLDGNLDNFYTWMKDTQYEDPREVFRMKGDMLHITGDGTGGDRHQ